MVLSHDSVARMFAPLASSDHMAFFSTCVSPDVVWTYSAPGAKHVLAGRYEGIQSFAAGTFAKIGGCFAAPLKMTLEDVIVDASKNTAVVELRTVGASKSGLAIEQTACWIIRANADDVLVEITSYLDSAFLIELLESNEEFLA